MDFIPDETSPIHTTVHEIAESLSGDRVLSLDVMEQELFLAAPDTNSAMIVLGIVENLQAQDRLSPTARDFFANYLLEQANANFDGNANDPNQQYNISQIIDSTLDLANGAANISTNIRTRNDVINLMMRCYGAIGNPEKLYRIITASHHLPQNSHLAKATARL